jgi:hypothetical protein
MSNITTYTHFQTIADTTWTIDHNLGKKVINDVYIDLPGDGIHVSYFKLFFDHNRHSDSIFVIYYVLIVELNYYFLHL